MVGAPGRCPNDRIMIAASWPPQLYRTAVPYKRRCWRLVGGAAGSGDVISRIVNGATCCWSRGDRGQVRFVGTGPLIHIGTSRKYILYIYSPRRKVLLNCLSSLLPYILSPLLIDYPWTRRSNPGLQPLAPLNSGPSFQVYSPCRIFTKLL